MFKNLNLNEVILTDLNFAPRRELAKEYLLQLDADRLLHTFRLNAGLPSDAEPLGGWEAPDCGLRGHFTGHFLSACAKFAFADGDDELRRKAEYIVDVMEQCAFPNGYLSAFEEGVLDTLEQEENRGVWAPYYTLHKILQGLADCAELLENKKAFALAVNLAHYIYDRFQKLSYWKIDGILRCTKVNPVNEFGGIGDALYSLYELSRDEKIWELATLFDRDYFIERLAAGQDILENLHANTHLPMVISAIHRYRIAGERKYETAAMNFYGYLRGRTFANGNSSSRATAAIAGQVSEKAEHWGAYGSLADSLTGGESESCCAHNTEKIVQNLFELTGDQRYLEHLENVKVNAVLNSASARTGLSQYHQPLGRNVVKSFSDKYDSFWCCTGTGIEAMSELQKNIWFVKENAILLNAFISSTVSVRETGVKIRQKTGYPDETESRIWIESAGNMGSCTLWLRSDRVDSVTVNGQTVNIDKGEPFVVLAELHKDDRIVVQIHAGLRLTMLQGCETRAAVSYENILLACIDSAAPLKGITKENILEHIIRLPGDKISFQLTDGCGKETVLIPLFRVEEEKYTVYLDLTGEEPEADLGAVQNGKAAYQ